MRLIRRSRSILVNIDERQSLAVRAARHVPVVFDDSEKFKRKGLYQSRSLMAGSPQAVTTTNASQRHLDSVAASARDASQLVRAAKANDKTRIDYGLISVDLPKVAAMMAADLPTRVYHTAYRQNAFDAHVQQGELHQRLLAYMYVVGKPVKGGHYGKPPSLTELDADGNVAHTTDFRRVYAGLIEGWLGYAHGRACCEESL